MNYRRKTLTGESNDLRMSHSRIGTPLRQMTITESFKFSKPKPFKMKEPYHISGVIFELDSDSDAETPPLFEFTDAAMKSDNDPETLYSNRTMGAPSPPKKPRTMIGVNYPSTSTPKTSPKKNVSPRTPKLSTIGSPPTLPSLNLSTGSRLSTDSNSSEKTITYECPASTSICWDEPTVPFPPNNFGLGLPNQINNEEHLVMNYEENMSDAVSSPENGSSGIRSSAIETNGKKNTAAKRLDFNSITGNSITSKKEMKRTVPKKNTTDSINQGNGSNSGNTTTAPKNRRKRKMVAELDNNDQKINRTVKDNSSRKQSTSKKGVITNVRSVTLTPLSSLSTKEPEISFGQHSPIQKPSSPATTQHSFRDSGTAPAQGSSKLPIIAGETSRKGRSSNPVLTKKEKLTDIIDKLRTNKDLTVNPVQLEKTSDNPQSPHQSKIGNPVMRATTSGLSHTGWIGKTSTNCKPGPKSRRLSSGIKGTNVNASKTSTPNQAFVKTNLSHSPLNNVAESQSIQYITDAIEKVIQDGLEKTLRKDTPRKTVVADDQQPVCSKSLVVNENSSKDTSGKKDFGTDTNKNIYTTPKKEKMGPNTPKKNGSLRRTSSGSPSKGSPIKNREIKALKSKEGKFLQVRQMDELIKLFQIAASNRHLRRLLDDQERDILQKFVIMEDNKKYFLMKLFVWKRIWYNIFNFCTKAKLELGDEKDINEIFQYLRDEKLVDTDYKTSSNLLELLNRLDMGRVKEIMEEHKIKPIKSKEENIKTILTAASRQATLTTKTFKDRIMDSIEKKMGFAIKIREDVFNTFYNAYLLATFTNRDFYNVENYFRSIIHLRVAFPETPVEDYPVFYTREKFLSYGRALKLITQMEEELTSKNSGSRFMGLYDIAQEAYRKLLELDTEDPDDHSKAPHLKRFTAQHVYTGILSSCCEKIYTKQNGQPGDVKIWLEYLIKKFPTSKRVGIWFKTLIRLHMRHLKVISYESAAKVLLKAFDTKHFVLGEIAKYDLGELGQQLKSSRRYKIDQIYNDRIIETIPRPIDCQNFPQQQIDSQCIRSEEMGKKREYISKNNGGMTVRGVEQVALKYYAENGYPEGIHCEGSITAALLMLFFWDIIYNPTKTIPGTFLSKLQNAPLDMFTLYFYTNRKELIDQRLKDIDSGWPEEKLINFAAGNWQNHSHEKAAFGMIMEVIKDEPTVEVLITVIGRRVLCKIFERLIKNLRAFRSGMPDLLVWNVEKKECRFVEVKGEGDRLSTGQKLWLQYLSDSGASIEVCWVHSMGSKRKKIKKVPTEYEQDNQAGPSSRPDD